ncbi:pilus assembly protein TadG-related protein [Tsuneonella sp. HG249]
MSWRPGNPWRDDSGAVAATYAIALMGLIVVAGVGYDYSRMASLDSELQNAADQAALAAATQLDRSTGACARASSAAVGLLRNLTMLSNDGGGNQVTVTGETACDATGTIRFYQDKDKVTAATSDANARFVEVHVDPREAFYALTPIMANFTGSGDLQARALAGVGSAICRVPPLMICSPDPSIPFDADNRRGIGIKATGKAGGANTWAPGDFGFLEVGSGQTADLAKALAFVNTNLDCVQVDEGTDPETGNAQVLYEAVNTRFDILPGGGGVLSPCETGSCPPARNVVKDVINTRTTPNANQCRLANNAWELPAEAERFRPRAWTSGDSSTSTFNASGTPLVMGYGRDMCHYNSYNRECRLQNGITFSATSTNDEKNRFGDGTWAIQDYFDKNHPGITPPSYDMSRYEVYLWEIENSYVFPTSTNQRPPNTCVPGTSDVDRRVLTVAIVSNCDELRGGSRIVEIDEWADVFLVEPVVDDSNEVANGRDRNMIYIEVIRKARLGGDNGAVSQAIRRDVPYLIQ